LKLLSKPPRIKVLEAIGCIGDERIREILSYAKTIAENKKSYLDDDDLDRIARKFNLESISD